MNSVCSSKCGKFCLTIGCLYQVGFYMACCGSDTLAILAIDNRNIINKNGL